MKEYAEQVAELIIRVRYSECDAQQVVFNARYADYADLAATEYIRSLLGSFDNLLKRGFDNQVVNLNIDWYYSAKFDDQLKLVCSPVHVGNTSFRLCTDMYVVHEETSELIKCASAKVTYVIVDTKNYQKHPIPDFLRDKFLTPFQSRCDQSQTVSTQI